MATNKELGLLTVILAAMQVPEAPYAMLSAKDVKGLLTDGLAVQNADIKDGDKLATRLTDAGIAQATPAPAEDNSAAATGWTQNTGGAAATGATAGKVEVGGFTFDTGLPIPAPRVRANLNGDSAMIDAMPAHASFFKADDGDKSATKILSSAMSTVRERYSEVVTDGEGKPVMEDYTHKGVTKSREKKAYERSFVIKTVTENGVKGARIYRVE